MSGTSTFGNWNNEGGAGDVAQHPQALELDSPVRAPNRFKPLDIDLRS